MAQNKGTLVNGIVLLTGATGRLGPHVLEALLRWGFRVRVATPDPVRESNRVTWVKTDFLDNPDYGRLVSGVNSIVHLAAELWDPSKMKRVNVHATEELAQAAEKQNVEVFVYASSVTVYGFPSNPLIDEKTPTLPVDDDFRAPYLHKQFLRDYAITKLEGERAIENVIKNTKLAILRFSNVTSERDIENILMTWPLWQRIWRGSRYINQVYVKDVAEAVVFVMKGILENRIKVGKQCEVFNVNDDDAERTRFVDLFRQYGEARGCRLCGCPIAMPAIFDFLKDRIKFRTISAALPAGALHFSSRKLVSLGFKYPFGIQNVQRHVIEKLSKRA